MQALRTPYASEWPASYSNITLGKTTHYLHIVIAKPIIGVRIGFHRVVFAIYAIRWGIHKLLPRKTMPATIPVMP